MQNLTHILKNFIYYKYYVCFRLKSLHLSNQYSLKQSRQTHTHTSLHKSHIDRQCVLTLETNGLNMCSTWHMATASIHRRKTHTEQSALNTGYQDNQKRMKPLNTFSFQMTRTHTHVLQVLPSSLTPLKLCCTPFAPFHPSPPVSQHCALNQSVSVCVKGIVVHGVAWDRLIDCQGHGTNKSSTQLTPEHTHAHAHTHTIRNIISSQIQRWSITDTWQITYRAAGSPRFPRSALTLSPTWR